MFEAEGRMEVKTDAGAGKETVPLEFRERVVQDTESLQSYLVLSRALDTRKQETSRLT